MSPLYFFPESLATFFLVASSAVSPLISSLQNLTTFFCSSLYRFLLLSLGCHPPRGVTLHFFYLSDLVSPLFFVNLPTFFSFGVTPWRVSPGAVCPPRPLVTPLVTDLLSCTVSKLRLIICKILARDSRALHFNALAGGDPLRI